MKALPPDAELQALAARINAQVPSGTRINFCRFEYPDGGAETGITFQCGDRRNTQRTRMILGEGDAPDLIRSLTNWAAKMAYQSRWTEDPGEAA